MQDMKNPRALSQEEVQMLLLDMMARVPSELTVAVMLPELIRCIAAISDRLTVKETSDLLAIAAIISRAVAAGEAVASVKVKVAKDTMQ